MLLSEFNDIKKLNREAFKKFFNCDVSYDSSFLFISNDEIAEKAYFDRKDYNEYGDSYATKEEEFEGMRLSKNKIEFFKEGEFHGLFIELLRENTLKVTFIKRCNSFTEEISPLYEDFRDNKFFFRYDFERLDSNFSKVKVKNFLVKNFNFFKESIEKCNNLLNSKLF